MSAADKATGCAVVGALCVIATTYLAQSGLPMAGLLVGAAGVSVAHAGGIIIGVHIGIKQGRPR